MQGTIQKQKFGYKWMRIGYAETRFSNIVIFVSLATMFFLATWVYNEIPKTNWRLINFLAIYLIAALLYTNLGVWLHEKLHCLAYQGTAHETHIVFQRKYFLFLNGHYRVRGAINYRNMRRALLAPFFLSIGLMVVGLIGNLALPGWWLPILLSLAVAGIIDMTHDLYMYMKIRSIGNKGKYWDTGKELEVVWKD